MTTSINPTGFSVISDQLFPQLVAADAALKTTFGALGTEANPIKAVQVQKALYEMTLAADTVTTALKVFFDGARNAISKAS